MILQTRVNFEIIRSQVTAAEELQTAGKNEASLRVLRELAKDIAKEVGK